MIKLHKIVTFALLVNSLYCLLGLHVLVREAAMLAKAMYQDTEGCLAKSQLVLEALRLTALGEDKPIIT